MEKVAKKFLSHEEAAAADAKTEMKRTGPQRLEMFFALQERYYPDAIQARTRARLSNYETRTELNT